VRVNLESGTPEEKVVIPQAALICIEMRYAKCIDEMSTFDDRLRFDNSARMIWVEKRHGRGMPCERRAFTCGEANPNN
jgi:hypothetical protein